MKIGYWRLVIAPLLIFPFASCGSDDRYNVIVISLDTLRPDHLTLYGYERDTSPVIAEFASRGVVFEQAFSQSPKTASSHMTILTGLYPSVHGIENLSEKNRRLSEEIPTIAGLLSQAGYRTEAMVGGGNVAGGLGFDRGFDTYAEPTDSQDPIQGAAPVLTRLARESSPFFLFVHTYQVHDPYVPDPAFADLYVDPSYEGEIISSQDELIEVSGGREYWQQYNAYWSRVDPTSSADAQHLRDLYDAEIRYTDVLMAEFFQLLDDLELFDNTIVILLSDHGEEFFEHGSALHNTLYQEVLRVPLVFRLPDSLGVASGQRLQNLARLVDIKPTILDAVGIAQPGHLQGDSLLPLMRGVQSEPQAVFSERIQGEKRFALQVDNWKYIRHPRGEELYDLNNDPGELTNIAADNETILRQLRSRAGRLVRLNESLAQKLQPGEAFQLEDQTRKQLEALGYIGEP